MDFGGNEWWIPMCNESGESIVPTLEDMGFQIIKTMGKVYCNVVPPTGWTGVEIATGDPLVTKGVIRDGHQTPRLRCFVDEADDYDWDPVDIIYTEVVT